MTVWLRVVGGGDGSNSDEREDDDEEDEEDAEVGEFGEVGEVGGEAKDTAVYRAAAASGAGTRRKETGCVLAGSGSPA